MDSFLRWLLPLYVVIYIALAFGWRSWLVWRQTGINPFALSQAGGAHATVGRIFGLTLFGLVITVIVLSLWPETTWFFVPIPYLDALVALKWIGLILLALSLIWIIVAQAQMGQSWRIGIDSNHATALVTTGIFRLSRNPIFLGMRLTQLGLFLLLPSAITLALLALGEASVQVQVQLEEEFLTRAHGDAYLAYRRQTHRWL